MRSLDELVNTLAPGIALVNGWLGEAEQAYELLPPSPSREDVLLGLQVTTRSPLGAVAYDTGGLIVGSGWLRILGSGNVRLPRDLVSWNAGRSSGFLLVADDAVGGFFALNGGNLPGEHGSVSYWGPDSLEWQPLEVGYSEFLQFALSAKLDDFYRDLRWPGWEAEVASLHCDCCFNFYPFLWTVEGTLSTASRAPVPTVVLRASLAPAAERQFWRFRE